VCFDRDVVTQIGSEESNTAVYRSRFYRQVGSTTGMQSDPAAAGRMLNGVLMRVKHIVHIVQSYVVAVGAMICGEMVLSEIACKNQSMAMEVRSKPR
jgi:hypothetical protein